MKQAALTLVTLLLLSGCTQTDGLDFVNNMPTPTNAKNSVAKAIEDFAQSVSASGNISNISVYDTKHFSKNDDSPIRIVASRSDSDQDFSIHTVSFCQNGNEGFAVVGESASLTKVYVYVPIGTPEEAKEVEPLKLILEQAPSYMAYDIIKNDSLIVRPPITPVPDSLEQAYNYEPITYVKWNQDAPYNKYAPGCSFDHLHFNNPYATHAYAGCGAVAVGQYFVTYGHYISEDGTEKDLQHLGLSQTYTSQTIDDIASFLLEVGLRLNTKYGCTGSSCSFWDITALISQCNINFSSKINQIDNNLIAKSLRKHAPVIIRGARTADGSNVEKPGTGHFWLIDGLKGTSSEPIYHCNWGWGGTGDCWTTSHPFQPETTTLFNTGFYTLYTH